MQNAIYSPITWANGASLSSFTLFKASGPNGLLIPDGMEGAQCRFVRAPLVNGVLDIANAVDVYDIQGQPVVFTIAATKRVIAFHPFAITGLGYIGLRTQTVGGVAQSQTGAITAYWLGIANDLIA